MRAESIDAEGLFEDLVEVAEEGAFADDERGAGGLGLGGGLGGLFGLGRPV
ncbi:MAG: hypothetical protein M5U12_14965 [Verrucomicrobia bacterium]|nr:hypothetical protein [Verrucomicrobiota bacterium]